MMTCGADPFGDDLIDDIEELTSDCNVLKNLSNSPSFTQRMEELIANTTENTEIGYWGRNDANNNMNYDDNDRFESEPNVMEITPPYPNDPIDSFIHNHFNNGTGTLPVFSGGDLYTIFNLYSENLIDQDYGNYVIDANISTALNEKRLAELFKDKGFGMSLYRGKRDSLNSWTRLKIKDNGGFKENNCN